MMAQEPSATINSDTPLAQAIVDTIREPLLVLDAELRVLTASRAFCRLFNAGRPVAEGCAFHTLGEGQWDIPELTRRLQAILATHTAFQNYETEQPAGSMGRRKMLLNAREVLYEHGCKAHILLSMEDVTERRAIERKLAEILQQKETLLQEIQHRVANSLQIIASILLLKARTVQSDETREHLHDAHRRVLSVASTQAHLRASRQGESIAMGPYLQQLCDALAGSMVSEHRAVKLKVQVERGDAASAEAVSLGLIVTELVINALKHGFTDDTVGGLIVVSYDVDGTAWRLTVCDNGCGMPEGEPQQKATGGLGTSIIAALARQLDARVELRTSTFGTAVSIVHGNLALPLPKPAGGWADTTTRATSQTQMETHRTWPVPMPAAVLVVTIGPIGCSPCGPRRARHELCLRHSHRSLRSGRRLHFQERENRRRDAGSDADRGLQRSSAPGHDDDCLRSCAAIAGGPPFFPRS